MSVNLTADQNLEWMNEAIEERQEAERRNYLGMSSIGVECERDLWYSFRQANDTRFAANTLYKFEDGHYSELITSKRLQLVAGLDLVTLNENNEQFGFSDIGDHFRGHADGFILGLYQARDRKHVWEHKCVDEKKFNKFEKLTQELKRNDVLLNWDLIYYGQAQMYMHYSGLDRHWLTVAYAGSRRYCAVRTDYRKSYADKLVKKAQDIIASDAPPPKISENAQFFQCRYCNNANICHGIDAAKSNCRTCIYSFPDTAKGGAKWYCQRYESYIDDDTMRRGKCTEHLYIPKILENVAEFIGADAEARTVTYRNKVNDKVFINGPGLDHYHSDEIACTDIACIGDVIVDDIKATFETRLGG